MIGFLTLAFLPVLAFAVNAQQSRQQTWKLDKAHSDIGFAVKHMVIATVKGEFQDYDGAIVFDGENVETGLVDFTINVVSINTGIERRDNHLKSADFFDVEKYPTIKFKSKKIVRGEDNQFKIIGDLTIKDITKEVTLDAVYHGKVTDSNGATRAGFSAGTTIKRHEFNIKWDNKLRDGSLVAGEDVKIEIEAELIRQET